MGNVLIHHGILGQKWGVRRFQNTDGSLTKAGKQRYGVGDVSKKEFEPSDYSKEAIENFKFNYQKRLEQLQKLDKKSTTTMYGTNKKRDDIYSESVSKYFQNMYNDINQYIKTNEKHELERVNEAFKLAGLEPLNLENYIEIKAKVGLDRPDGYEKAMKYIAAYQAFRSMGSENWLPSEAKEIDENVKKQKEAYANLEKAGLSGLFKVDLFDGEVVCMYVKPGAKFGVDGRPANREDVEYFDPTDIKGMQRFAIENNLFSKDFRKSSNARTREKNIDTSVGAKTVQKREVINISETERSKKEASSKKEDQKRVAKNKEMLDQIIEGQKRTKAAIKQDEARKKLRHSELLIHHGILNQKWGVRNGPPYPLGGGDYSPSEKRAIKGQRRAGNSIYNKKHFDEVLKADRTTLSTLSYDENRTKNTDMFYATHDIWDKHQYNALFNAKVPKTLYDESGKAIGTGTCLKFRIDNSLKSDIKVASEDSGAKIFKNLYKKDRDFYNFVTDPNRMENYFVKEKYKFKGYQEVKTVLRKMRSSNYNPTEEDVHTLYRMFNYVIPYDGQGNARKGNDVTTQRTKFFKELKEAGYGAVLDTNDAIYGGFKAKSPVIVFDMDQIIPKDIYQTTMNDKRVSNAALVMRKLLGI